MAEIATGTGEAEVETDMGAVAEDVTEEVVVAAAEDLEVEEDMAVVVATEEAAVSRANSLAED